jgi:hypothetical protein
MTFLNFLKYYYLQDITWVSTLLLKQRDTYNLYTSSNVGDGKIRRKTRYRGRLDIPMDYPRENTSRVSWI